MLLMGRGIREAFSDLLSQIGTLVSSRAPIWNSTIYEIPVAAWYEAESILSHDTVCN